MASSIIIGCIPGIASIFQGLTTHPLLTLSGTDSLTQIGLKIRAPSYSRDPRLAHDSPYRLFQGPTTHPLLTLSGTDSLAKVHAKNNTFVVFQGAMIRP